MESNLNHSFIESYSKSFAAKVADAFYKDRELITGGEILNVCSIRQVNLFVVKVLLMKWKEESSKIKSPYFDYEEKAVKKALREFLNLLSQHIAIEKQHFLPLLERAVFETLLLIMSPYDYYSQEINNPERTRVSLKWLKEATKYIKVNKHVMDGVIAHFERDGLKEVFNDEAFRILNEVFGELADAPEDVDDYVEMFSEIEPLDINAIYGTSAQEDEEDDDIPSVFNVKSTSNESPAVSKKPANPVVENKPATPSPDVATEREVEKSNLNDSFSAPKETLNDRLTTEQRPTLADIHQQQKIVSIKSHVTLNQKFMFINELFDGNAENFENVVNFLDSCQSKNQALNYLRNHYSNWDIDNEGVKEFMEVVDKKYQ